MTLLRQLAVAALPGGIIALAAYRLLRCHHRHELQDRDEMGLPILRCADCLRARPHPWHGEPRRYMLTQPGDPERTRQYSGAWAERELRGSRYDGPVTDEKLWGKR